MSDPVSVVEAVCLLEAGGHLRDTGRAKDVEGLLSPGDPRLHRPLAELSDVIRVEMREQYAAERSPRHPDQLSDLL